MGRMNLIHGAGHIQVHFLFILLKYIYLFHKCINVTPAT